MVNILVPLSRRISKDAFLQDVRDATSNVSTLEFWSRAWQSSSTRQIRKNFNQQPYASNVSYTSSCRNTTNTTMPTQACYDRATASGRSDWNVRTRKKCSTSGNIKVLHEVTEAQLNKCHKTDIKMVEKMISEGNRLSPKDRCHYTYIKLVNFVLLLIFHLFFCSSLPFYFWKDIQIVEWLSLHFSCLLHFFL